MNVYLYKYWGVHFVLLELLLFMSMYKMNIALFSAVSKKKKNDNTACIMMHTYFTT